MEDRFAALAAEAEKGEGQRRSWSGTNEGDESTIVGEMVGFDVWQSDDGPVRIAVLRLESGEEISVWLSRSVLRNEVEAWKPRQGELVAIAYLGEKQPKSGGNAYHNYNVKVEGRSKPFGDDGTDDLPTFDAADGATQAFLQQERDARDAAASEEIPF